MGILVRVAQATLAILDVGHGNACILREGGVVLLVDAGRGSDVLEYLQENHIDAIDMILVSHSDADHIGGLVGLLTAGIAIKQIRLNSDAEKDSEGWRDLIFTFEDARRKGAVRFDVGLSIGEVGVEGLTRCRAEIVAPTPGLVALGAGSKDRSGRRITSNSISASVRIHYDGVPVALLTGDMDEVSLDDCIAAGTDLGAPVVVFPHHGGLPGSGDAAEFAAKLMDRTKANKVFFSIGRLKHDNPRPEIVKIVRAKGAYVACTQLSKHCAEDLSGPPSDVSGSYSAGRKKGLCCAGTVEVDLTAAAPSLRAQEAHVKFVASVKTPLCQ
jgi:beta-lactamase superfamily II metal-dependent hydrolase